jgi:hypothetical protein
MNFGLLVSQLPHVQESHAHYDAMLALHAREPRRFVVLWHAIKARVSSLHGAFWLPRPEGRAASEV